MSLDNGWSEFKKYMSESKDRFAKSKERLLTSTVGNIAREIQEAIIHQRIEGPPLLPETRKEKARLSQSNLKLVATGEYARSFGVLRVDKNTMVIGPTDERNQKLADFHEFGTRNIPARPHIRPVVMNLNQKIPGVLQREGFIFTGKK